VDDNPHITRTSRHKHWFSINVWVGILGDQHLGPVILTNRLTYAWYHRFSVNDLPVIFENMPVPQRQHMWFMHDGAPPYFLHIVRQHLNQTSGEQWTVHWGSVNWPTWSPDINSLDFWLWRHLKILVYSAPISDTEVLQRWVENGFYEIRVKPGIFEGEHTSTTKSWKLCWNAWEPHSICCRDHTNITNISAGTGFWTYVDWELFTHLSEYYAPLNLVPSFYTLYICWANYAFLHLEEDKV
jgi:hypothetical protein